MLNQAYYEERILNEVRLLPEVALPRVVQWLSRFRQDLIFSEANQMGIETDLKTKPPETQQTFSTHRTINVEEILQIGRDCAALPDVDTRTPLSAILRK